MKPDLKHMVFPFVNYNMEPKRFLFRQNGDTIEQTHLPFSQKTLKFSNKLFAVTQNACRGLDKWLFTIEVFRPMQDEIEITNTGFNGIRVHQYFRYGNTGCQVFKWGKKLERFLLKNQHTLPKEISEF